LALSQQRALLEYHRTVLEEQQCLQERQQAQLDSILAVIGSSAGAGAEDGFGTHSPAVKQRRCTITAALNTTAIPPALFDCRAGVEDRPSQATLKIVHVPTAPAVLVELQESSPAFVPGQDGSQAGQISGLG
jgi:hypothetical protein